MFYEVLLLLDLQFPFGSASRVTLLKKQYDILEKGHETLTCSFNINENHLRANVLSALQHGDCNLPSSLQGEQNDDRGGGLLSDRL